MRVDAVLVLVVLSVADCQQFDPFAHNLPPQTVLLQLQKEFAIASTFAAVAVNVMPEIWERQTQK